MQAAQEIDLANNDLGPLAWVLDELRKSLESASSALRRFVRDAAQARGQDLSSIDSGQLRIARQHMHQAVGALEMVGMAAPAHMLRSMEAAAQKFIERPELCTEAAAAKVERAGFALAEYLEALLGGKDVSPVSLFVQYKDVQDLTGADRVHPADLWGMDWRWNDFPAPAAAHALAYEPAVRARMDQGVLKIVKAADPAAGRELTEVSLGLSASQNARQPKVFWKAAAGYFEAIALGLLPADVYVKRAASRVLLQYASLAKGEHGVSERLAQDLVFFCAQAVPARATDAPALAAVRHGFGLANAKPVDYATSPFGRFDPMLLAQLRKRIATAKETWSGLAGGDAHKLKGVRDQFLHLGETLGKLYPASEPLAKAMSAAVETVATTARAPSAELAMEVATAILYLEAAFQDLDPNDQQLADRTARLADRLKKVVQGGAPEPLEHWVEDLYRRVSDKQTMGSVVGELRGTLGELEKLLDQFFRNTADKTPLGDAPGFLAQMRGVLSVLGLDQASQAVLRMRDTVENIIVTEVDDELARGAGTFEKLGNNLGALGFLIDMLNYQPSLAKKLFVWDDERGELRPLMGREPDAVPSAMLTAHAAAPVPAPAAVPVAPPVVHAAPAPAAVPVAVVEEDEGDAELREIFLEEAREVIGNGLAAIAALAEDPRNLADMTTLRRAFHTLKGSSRMVKLNEFGEAAWSLEQVLNTWLADQKPASEELRQLATDALQGFGRWIEAIATRTDAAWKAVAFHTAADAMRTHNALQPIALPQPGLEQAAAAVEEVLRAEPMLDVPAAIEPPAAPVPAFADLGFTLDLDPPAEAVAPAEPAMPELGTAESAFDFDFTALDKVDAEAVPGSAEVTVQELSADELPPEFAALGATMILPREQASQPQPEPTIEELPELAATAILPKLELDLAPAAQELSLEIEGIDFSSLSAVSGPAPEGAAPEAEAVVAEDFVFELAAEPEAPALLEAQAEAEVQAEAEPEIQAEAEPEAEVAAEAEPEVLEAEVLAPELLEPEVLAEAELEAQAESEPTSAKLDEQTKVIGDLRIGIPLYNVYLNEADEWSRRLVTEISEWTLQMSERVPDSTVGWAHALAGSSATVGFQALSDIARALEGALQHTQSLADGTPQHARTFTEAAEEVRRLLHQFAAGFLKKPEARLLQELHALKEFEGEIRCEEQESCFDEDDSGFATSVPAEEPVAAAAPVRAPIAITLPPAAALAPLLKAHGDEELDVVDAIDPDLFPIFEEEGAELMPKLASGLRAWAAHPGQREPRDQVLRALHTLKGSARLAGALQLGELAHRMESEVEFLGHENIAAVDIEALLQRFDTMQARFDTLRATGGFAPAEPQAVEEAASFAVVEEPASEPDASSVAEQAASPIGPESIEASEPAAAQPAAPVARMPIAGPVQTALTPSRQASNQAVRVRAQLLDRLVNQAGEVMITRSRLESELRQLRGSLGDLTGNLDRLRAQLREIEVQAESQMQSRMAQAKDTASGFDPLEFDRFTRVQELTRLMAESVNDVATVQRNIQRVVEATEDDLIAQARQTRELQRDLLRTRMVEFDGISERLYRVVRLAAKETGKQVKLDVIGASIEMDRGVLDRMTPAFEHLLRNCVAHGIEAPEQRSAQGKEASGNIVVHVRQEGNDVSVEFRDDGAGLDLPRIRDKALQQGLVTADQQISTEEAANLIFLPGFSTAAQVTELSGRGVGMDVVRNEVNALGGRIETTTEAGRGTTFKLVLPLTTAVTQVVMVRSGKLSIGVPAHLVELVRRASIDDVQKAYATGTFEFGGEQLPFFWSGALLQSSPRSTEPQGKTLPVVIFRSAAQRVAVHLDEVLGNQEVVVKNLGPQLSRLPGLAGMTVLASGAVVLIYNPVALVQVYGELARQMGAERAEAAKAQRDGQPVKPATVAAAPTVPLVLVVDDSITVRRVTQRLLAREGYRVALAADGLQALERLAEELPAVVLSDIEMPRMDGFDLARNIRADERLRHLPIVMITSRIAEKHREHAKELGVNHYLGKPYSEEELLGLVRQYSRAAVTA
ncbi:hybrid sensor histidine kinase/response regulator [Ramlibacter alkalitolerans]|uniref:histidine kinase n=1 Tax=Ramlibacter alkalitolerans TaxID=2039631 RepID=A0ABS1JST8_9BURK|nr:Hpt domain-containing protein [Ramlibacter alkalitolerans]MBL0427307.1 Hpt domain-containing protein [Ramlibacter alkalitolerans]